MRDRDVPSGIELPVAPGEAATTVDRRRFLRQAASTAIGALAGALALPEVVRFRVEAAGGNRGPNVRHRWVMVFDLRNCDGCRACTRACQDMHHLGAEFEYIKVHERHTAAGQKYFMPVPCMMCQNAPCHRVCPTGATFYGDDGLVLIDQDRCIGCRACIAACPYDSRYFNFESSQPEDPESVPWTPGPHFPGFQERGTVGKCAFCSHLLDDGMLPACVEICSMGAIYIGDWDRDLATNGRETHQLSSLLRDQDAWRFKEELNTQPSVYYISGHAQNLTYY